MLQPIQVMMCMVSSMCTVCLMECYSRNDDVRTFSKVGVQESPMNEQWQLPLAASLLPICVDQQCCVPMYVHCHRPCDGVIYFVFLIMSSDKLG